MPTKIAIVGAGHTGKTRLARDLAQALRMRGHSVRIIPTPPGGDAAAPTDASGSRFIIADGTPLLEAVHRDLHFADASLNASALAQQRDYDLTLLAGLDLLGAASDPHQREATDALLRGALARAGLPYRVVYGLGESRWKSALSIVDVITPENSIAINSIAENGHPMRAGSLNDSKPGAWTWFCDKCSDPLCEHRLFSTRLRAEPADSPTARPRSEESASRWR